MLRRLLSTSILKVNMLNPKQPTVTELVQSSMEKLFPLSLADRSWDNVGLLLEPPSPRPRTAFPPKVLLTIDLTTDVAEEALEESSRIETIVTYRNPPLLHSDLRSPHF